MRTIDGSARRWAARGCAALVVGTAIATLVAVAVIDDRIGEAGRTDLLVLGGVGVAFSAALLVSAVVGGWLIARRPRHPVGWCFALLSVGLDVAAVGQAYGSYGLFVRTGGLPGDDVAALASSVAFVLWLVAIALVCSLTPDGHHLSPRWRRASWAMVGTGLMWLALKLISTAPLEAPFESVANPWAIDGLGLGGLQRLLATVNNVLVLAAAVSVGIRFRRSQGEARRQLLWMAIVAVPFIALVLVAFVAATIDNDGLLNVAAAGFVALPPIGAFLAIERYRLYDVDRILTRTLGYVVVSAPIAAIYAVVVVLAARVIDERASSSPTAVGLATLAAVIAVRPVHAAVQDLVDRRFARRRYDAVRQASAFVADPASHPSAEGALRAALGDPSVLVAYPLAGSEQWVSEDGHVVEVGEAWRRVTRAGRVVAAVVHHSDPGLVEAVLDVAAPELDNAGLRAAVALQLQEVMASRRRIAEAQLDERRRIERDLHDGAQQRLLGTAAQLQAALLNGDPARMRDALELGMAECRHAVVELRELANGLHPAVLADGGLAAALEQLPSRFALLTVDDVPEARYPPSVESTLWFATCEALANTVKHAAASSVRVALRELEDRSLRLVVADDGQGGADANGRGLRGLADRVEAVGGRLQVGPGAAGGTLVEVVVPCAW